MKFKFLLIACILTSLLTAQNTVPFSREISENWTFQCQTDYPNQLHGVATVPGNIHTDLLAAEAIPHPYEGMNELDLQWIQDSIWVYQTTFQISSKELEFSNIFLEFEGLDTYATIYLNGLEIGTSDNMFLAWQNEVKTWLKNGDNHLKVVIDSPYRIHKNTTENVGYQLPASNDAGENKISPWVRKSPYHFGWDWAPKFTTCGIYLPVNLKFENELFIEDVYVYTSSVSEEEAIVEYEITLNKAPSKTDYNISISDLDGAYFEKTSSTDFQKITGKCKISNPKIWWPNGWGEQPLLDFKFKLGTIEHNEKIGIRMARVHQKKDTTGESFYFEVNGQPIFAKGANYIPQDVFINNKSPEDYEKLILQAKDANFNMLRVWGGGIYEKDYFYELCDQHGLLVWQDLMFACSMYPGGKDYMTSVSEEISYQVKRLRNHACLAHWNGNNEVNVAWHNWGWQKKYALDSIDQIKIKADYDRVFKDLIPKIIYGLDKRTYTHTSPLSNWGPNGDFDSGSMHYWGVWHNKEPFENYYENVGRFTSEYGFQSFPDIELLQRYIPSDSLFLASESMKHRQKSYIGNGLILNHVLHYFPEPKTFEEFVELSQLTQAIAYEKAIEAHRFKRPHSMGTLYWQLNDCWPGPSWSTIDYEGNEKLAHKKVKQMYQTIIPILVQNPENLELFLSNDSKTEEKGILTVKKMKSKNDKVIYEETISFSIGATETLSLQLLEDKPKRKADAYFIIEGTSENGLSFSRTIIPDVNSFVLEQSIEKFKQLFTY